MYYYRVNRARGKSNPNEAALNEDEEFDPEMPEFMEGYDSSSSEEMTMGTILVDPVCRVGRTIIPVRKTRMMRTLLWRSLTHLIITARARSTLPYQLHAPNISVLVLVPTRHHQIRNHRLGKRPAVGHCLFRI